MKAFLNNSIVSRLVRSPKPVRLGRWSVENDAKTVDRKVSLANHDNCGPCPPLKKRKSRVEATNTFDNSMDISLCALQSFHSYPRHFS